jgi:hypothetical protein
VAHRVEVGITRRAEGKEGPAFIGVMTEEKSVELASKIASEGFVFAVRRAPAPRGPSPVRASAARWPARPSAPADPRAGPNPHPLRPPTRPTTPTYPLKKQFGAVLVFAEYDRNRKKELKKQRREEAERAQIMGRAREEREVRRQRDARARAPRPHRGRAALPCAGGPRAAARQRQVPCLLPPLAQPPNLSCPPPPPHPTPTPPSLPRRSA